VAGLESNQDNRQSSKKNSNCQLFVHIRLYLLMIGLDTTETCRGWQNVLRINFIFLCPCIVKQIEILSKKMRLYSVYYISVGSCTCFGCWHTSSGAGTAVITASAIDWADGSRPGWPVPEAVITVVGAPDDRCQQPKHVELPTEML